MEHGQKIPFHLPVLLNEVIEGLHIVQGGHYIDATVGGGGHTLAILKKGGNVLGIDRDRDALAYARKIIDKEGETLKAKATLVQGNFGDIREIVQKQGISSITGILFDLGISTYQIKQSGRGFSFLRSEPLDMRMDQETGVLVEEVVNRAHSEELIDIFTRYGEEELAEPIAYAIIQSRTKNRIKTTTDLVAIVKNVYEKRHKKSTIHPATKVFQALRIAVNDELGQLKKAFVNTFELLDSRGRIAIISFHSLEDRIVKQSLRKDGLRMVNKKPMTPSLEEIKSNPASRSAKLRIGEKI